ncbi:SDR family NAD(P)-dependent oxidoreductase [Saccharothrix syringae]|uniref:SDR family NAD(P)-dependent oxidoreductase n=1 Tax=Saccharothrix syringae TaxID=103733 RepID=UPI000689AA48|nr:SDR family NAD(P)-dependent oxidoreductase [Saccharothrix syringae]
MPQQRIAVVTGGAGGIGLAIARRLAARGHRVVVVDRDAAGCRAAAGSVGAGCAGEVLDVTDTDAVRRLVERVEADLGPIDVWVNNAGTCPVGTLDSLSPEVVDRAIDVNYRALVQACRIVVPRMRDRGRGRVVNIASPTGITPLAGMAVYSGTKAAVLAFSQALHRELRGTGVGVLVVHPHHTDTAMGSAVAPMALLGPLRPDTVARGVVAALERGRCEVSVPRWIRLPATLARVLPWPVQDALVRISGLADVGRPSAPR